LQQFQNVARETGVPVSELERGLQRLNTVFSEAANDSASARETLNRLGLAWTTSTGDTRTATEALGEFADAWKKLPIAEQSELLTRTFGRNSQEMRNFLALGSEGIQKLRDETSAVSDEALKNLKSLDDEFVKVSASIKGEFLEAVGKIAPAIEGALKTIVNLTSLIGGLFKSIDDWLHSPLVQKFIWGPELLMGQPTPLTTPGVKADTFDYQQLLGTLQIAGSGGPTKTPGEHIADIAQEVAKATAAINAARASAIAAAPGGAEGKIQDIEAQITATQKLLDVTLGGLQATSEWTETSKGKTELATKAIVDQGAAVVKLTELRKQLADAEMARATEQAQDIAHSIQAEDELNQSLDVGRKNLLEWEKQDRARQEELRLGTLGAQSFIPHEEQGAVDAAMKSYGDTIKQLESQTKLWGDSLESVNTELQATQRAMVALDQAGANGTAIFNQLAERAARLQVLQTVLNGVHTVLQSVGSNFADALISIEQHTKSTSQAFSDMAKGIAADLQRYAIEAGVKLLEQALTKLIIKLAQMGLAALTGPSTTPVGSYPTTNIPAGESFSSGGGDIPTFASGGVVTGRTLAIVGDQGPEAIVPLDQLQPGRPLPMPGAGYGGPLVQVQIVNQMPNAEVDHQVSTTATGQELHNFVIREVNRSIANGEMDSILKPYAMRRVPTGR
jgi:hypothetical protein